MNYQVKIISSAQKDIEKLPKKIAVRIRQSIEQLSQQPRPDKVKKMKGAQSNLYRIRVGDYRILYEIHDKKLIIIVVAAAHRRDVYK